MIAKQTNAAGLQKTINRPSRAKAKLPRPLEKDVKKAIVETINLIPGVFVWPNNVGAYKKDKRFIRFGLVAGSADLIGIASGRFFALEIKRDSKAKPTELQIAWVNRVIDLGGFAAVVSSVSDATSAAFAAKVGKLAAKIPPIPARPIRKTKPTTQKPGAR